MGLESSVETTGRRLCQVAFLRILPALRYALVRQPSIYCYLGAKTKAPTMPLAHIIREQLWFHWGTEGKIGRGQNIILGNVRNTLLHGFFARTSSSWKETFAKRGCFPMTKTAQRGSKLAPLNVALVPAKAVKTTAIGHIGAQWLGAQRALAGEYALLRSEHRTLLAMPSARHWL